MKRPQPLAADVRRRTRSPRLVHPPIHDAGRARLLPSRDQTGSFGSAGASPYQVKMKMPGHRPSFLLTSAATVVAGGIPGRFQIGLPSAPSYTAPMLARACSAAVNGIEAYAVEVEVNS